MRGTLARSWQAAEAYSYRGIFCGADTGVGPTFGFCVFYPFVSNKPRLDRGCDDTVTSRMCVEFNKRRNTHGDEKAEHLTSQVRRHESHTTQVTTEVSSVTRHTSQVTRRHPPTHRYRED